MDKKLTFVVIGLGQRGQRYLENAYLCGNFELVGIAEPDDTIRSHIQNQYGLPTDRCFCSYEELFSLGRIADFAVIATQDQLHLKPSLMAIEQGYDLLLEKPIANTPQDCMAIYRAATQKCVKILVCHVLRYTPFARAVKEIIDQGKLGKIVSVIHSEGVGHIHYSHSYVRGNWHNRAKSSDMLLAKSCHDIDLLQWFLGRQPKRIQSFGSLSYFLPKDCPPGAPQRCIDGCPVSEHCPYNAVKIYRDYTDEEMGDIGWVREAATRKHNPSEEDIYKILTETDYGKCVYRCDNDVVDHQTVNMEYENGETVIFSMCAYNEGGRRIQIMGTKGELISTDFDTIELFTFNDNRDNAPQKDHWYKETIHTSEEGISQAITGGHGGGDIGIIDDLWKILGEGITTKSVSDIRTSVVNHLTVFAAEESRKNGSVTVDVDAYVNRIFQEFDT